MPLSRRQDSELKAFFKDINPSRIANAIKVTFFILLVSGCSNKDEIEISDYDSVALHEMQNVALNKPYQVSVAANYPLTTDFDDAIQLTNGRASSGHFWSNKETVGWANKERIDLTFDLEGIYQLREIQLTTAANDKGEVHLPRAILVYTSTNDRDYTLVGDLTGRIKPEDEIAISYTKTTMKLELEVEASRVQLVVVPNGRYVFFDEIIILGQPISQRSSSAVSPENDSRILNPRKRLAIDNDLVRKSAARRSKSDLRIVKNLYAKSISEIGREVQHLDDQHAEFFSNWTPPYNFETTYPQNDFHKQVFDIQSHAWKANGLSPVHVWSENRWNNLDIFQMPPVAAESLSITVGMNEIRSVSVNISTTVDTTLTLKIVNLPNSVVRGISVSEVGTTDSPASGPTSTVLHKADCHSAECTISLVGGLTKKIWIRISSHGVNEGLHSGAVEVGSQRIPLRLQVYPIDISRGRTPLLSGWDYTESRYYGVTDENANNLVETLREYKVAIPWGTPATLTTGDYSSAGIMLSSPNTDLASKWIQRWGGMSKYAIYVAVKPNFAGFFRGTPEFDQAVSQWISWWEKWFREQGIDSHKLMLLLVDEPRNQEHIDLFHAYQRVITRTSPGIVLIENPIFKNPADGQSIIQESDIVVPLISRLNDERDASFDFFTSLTNEKTLWLYSIAENSLGKDPYSFYRLQSWMAWRLGATGSAFWSFGDAGYESSWNQYLAGKPESSPLFIDSTRIASSIHMEAIWEGQQDFAYLSLLSEALPDSADIFDARLYSDVREVLDERVRRITEEYNSVNREYSNKKLDRSQADVLRVRVLELLTALQDQK